MKAVAFALVGFLLIVALSGFGEFGKMGVIRHQKSAGGGGVSACATGNLLLVYSDPCNLMSQMVGN